MKAPGSIALELTAAALAIAFAGALVHAAGRGPEPVEPAQRIETAAPREEARAEGVEVQPRSEAGNARAPAGSNDFTPGPRAGN